MNVSPVQLRFYVFTRLGVDPGERVPLSLAPVGSEGPFHWDGVRVDQQVEFGWADGQENDPRSFALRLGLLISNESGNPAPYKIDIEALGYFDLMGNIKREEREDIAKVNGASLLYGAMRDVIYSTTARFHKGALILPSVNFFDLKAGKQKEEVAPAKA